MDVTGLTSGVVAISGRGGSHTCALTTGAGVKCWGNNSSGQLGDGTTNQRLMAVDVMGLTSGVAAISAGQQHSCVSTTAGGVKCWGNNDRGQLGDGTQARRLTPLDVTGLTSIVAAISADLRHTCAVTTSGGVKCWGNNDYGRLGDGTTTQRLTAVDVTGLTSGVATSAAGQLHTCALTTGGGVKCWGNNDYGQLGDGSTTTRLTPVDVAGLTTDVTAIDAGISHTCALTTGGGVKCWGSNFFGELGDGTTTQRLTAVDVVGLTSGVAAISAGGPHTCALMTAGGVKCWGNNSGGQLGDGTTTQRLTAVDVTGLVGGVAAISAGSNHTCALTTGAGLKCWGNNSSGQLGDGTTNLRLTAVDVTGLTSGVAAILAGSLHTCAVTTGGGAKCWGRNYEGQLGNGERGFSPNPTAAVGFGPPCSNGTLDSGEQCDDGNTANGDCCSSTCQFESSATICRAAVAECDVADTCTGSSATCPTNTFATSGTSCTDDGNVCTNDQCNGSGTCTHPNNTASCDDGLFCTGTDTCSGGSCSVHAGDPCVGGAECANTCDEINNTCNAPAGTACTADSSVCSLDICNGSGACTHPAGNAGATCRSSAGDCDLPETCDGASPTCPTDLFQPSTLTCRAATGECDVAEHCSGASPTCPADGFVTTGMACSDDGQPCTNDSCDGGGVCEHVALPDTDGDSVCDAQDTCTNVGDARDFYVKSKLVLSKINTDTTPGNDGLKVSASFDLPSFSALNPIANGARIVLLNQAGGVEVDQVLPGGAYTGSGTRGWKTNTKGTVWQYLDKTTSPLSGISTLKVTDKSKSSPGHVTAALTGKKTTYLVLSSDPPVQLVVVLGNQTDAIAGYCGESDFTPGDCLFNGAQNSLVCRQ